MPAGGNPVAWSEEPDSTLWATIPIKLEAF